MKEHKHIIKMEISGDIHLSYPQNSMVISVYKITGIWRHDDIYFENKNVLVLISWLKT